MKKEYIYIINHKTKFVHYTLKMSNSSQFYSYWLSLTCVLSVRNVANNYAFPYIVY